jgi:hypothetical protein
MVHRGIPPIKRHDPNEPKKQLIPEKFQNLTLPGYLFPFPWAENQQNYHVEIN